MVKNHARKNAARAAGGKHTDAIRSVNGERLERRRDIAKSERLQVGLDTIGTPVYWQRANEPHLMPMGDRDALPLHDSREDVPGSETRPIDISSLTPHELIVWGPLTSKSIRADDTRPAAAALDLEVIDLGHRGGDPKIDPSLSVPAHRMVLVDGEIEVCAGCLNSEGNNVNWEDAARMQHTLLHHGDRVKLGHDSTEKRWWTVRQLDERFVILTRQADFRPKGELFYTIIDWDRGVRGPCDLLFPKWDVAEDEDCADMLRALSAHAEREAQPLEAEERRASTELTTQVSHRNNVPITILAHDRSARP